MSGLSLHQTVQILRSETRPKELQVAEFGLDEAKVSPAICLVARPLGSFSPILPLSPPYTNPHLKRAIPLPFVDENGHCHKSGPMQSEKDAIQCVFQGEHGPSSLLSPPYSPRRRTLTLLSVDENEEESEDFCTVPLSAGTTLAESFVGSWRENEDELDMLEPPSMEVRDLDIGEESDDWDVPLFLNGPSTLDSSDSLALNLFGGVHSGDDEKLSRSRLDPPDSPGVPTSSLPVFDCESHMNKPLFDPTDFNVFENDWDTVTSNLSQSSPISSYASSQCTVFSPTHESHQHQQLGFHEPMETFRFNPPTSPSRRSLVALPNDAHFPHETLGAPASTVEGNQLSTQNIDLLECIPFQHKPPSSHRRQPSDVPSEILQTPFSLPYMLPSSLIRSSPSHSLLFAPLEPQDIPLPESPEDYGLQLRTDFDVPPHRLEENRIRILHQEMLATEAEARNKEIMLTEYIARLNSAKPMPLPLPVPVYSPRPQPESASKIPTTAENDIHTSSNGPALLLSHRPAPPPPVPITYAQPYTSSSDHLNFEFLQARHREVQTAVMMRAAERKRRKRAKERVRELDALLQLKSGQMHTADPWELAAPRGRLGDTDDTIVLVASGSDHARSMLFDGGFTSEILPRDRQGEIMQLVAKMIFRRRDSPRPLSGKPVSTVRKYVRSGLSRSIYANISDDEETSNDNENLA